MFTFPLNSIHQSLSCYHYVREILTESRNNCCKDTRNRKTWRSQPCCKSHVESADYPLWFL